MHPTLADDLADFTAILDATRKHADEYLAGLEQRRVAASVTNAPLTGDLPDQGVGAQQTLERFRNEFDHLLSASPGPRYLGFVTGGSTPAALAADWLASTFDQNAQFNGDTIAAHIEQQALGWLGEILGLSKAHTGIAVTGATMANFTGLAIARQWLGERHGVNIAEEGIGAMPDIHALSGSAHSSISKALAMLGIGRKALQTVSALPNREAVDVAALEKQLAALQGKPVIVNANAGIVNTGDFDDIAAIAALKDRYEFWLHVDGAFGAFAAASPDYSHYTTGMEKADSLTVDGHKWLNVPYDCGFLYTKHLTSQIEVFKNASPYLPAPVADPRNVLHLGPENSRRWRALPVWFTLQAYGREGVREIVERDCAMAKRLGDRIDSLDGYELLAPVDFNIVCFSFADNATSERVNNLRDYLIENNAAYLSPTIHAGKPALRAALCNWRTQPEHVDEIATALQAFQSK